MDNRSQVQLEEDGGGSGSALWLHYTGSDKEKLVPYGTVAETRKRVTKLEQRGLQMLSNMLTQCLTENDYISNYIYAKYL